MTCEFLYLLSSICHLLLHFFCYSSYLNWLLTVLDCCEHLVSLQTGKTYKLKITCDKERRQRLMTRKPDRKLPDREEQCTNRLRALCIAYPLVTLLQEGGQEAQEKMTNYWNISSHKNSIPLKKYNPCTQVQSCDFHSLSWSNSDVIEHFCTNNRDNIGITLLFWYRHSSNRHSVGNLIL